LMSKGVKDKIKVFELGNSACFRYQLGEFKRR
jgi:hypothetical protein